MLKKLIKYDIREFMRSTLPMFIASLVVSVICCGLLFFTYSFSKTDGMFAGFLTTIGFFGIGILAIAVMSVVSELVAVARYYKSLFTDEGYLNMVIPVKASALFSAKLISVMLWFVVTSVVTIVSLFIAVFFPTLLYDVTYITDVIDLLLILFGNNYQVNVFGIIVGIFSSAVSIIESAILILTAITVGSVMIRKHKILGSLIFFFVVTFVTSIIESIVSLGCNFVLAELCKLDYILTQSIATLVNSVIFLGVAVLLYFVNVKILDKKFNID